MPCRPEDDTVRSSLRRSDRSGALIAPCLALEHVTFECEVDAPVGGRKGHRCRGGGAARTSARGVRRHRCSPVHRYCALVCREMRRRICVLLRGRWEEPQRNTAVAANAHAGCTRREEWKARIDCAMPQSLGDIVHAPDGSGGQGSSVRCHSTGSFVSSSTVAGRFVYAPASCGRRRVPRPQPFDPSPWATRRRRRRQRRAPLHEYTNGARRGHDGRARGSVEEARLRGGRRLERRGAELAHRAEKPGMKRDAARAPPARSREDRGELFVPSARKKHSRDRDEAAFVHHRLQCTASGSAGAAATVARKAAPRCSERRRGSSDSAVLLPQWRQERTLARRTWRPGNRRLDLLRRDALSKRERAQRVAQLAVPHACAKARTEDLHEECLGAHAAKPAWRLRAQPCSPAQGDKALKRQACSACALAESCARLKRGNERVAELRHGGEGSVARRRCCVRAHALRARRRVDVLPRRPLHRGGAPYRRGCPKHGASGNVHVKT
jgi:hypothetical protein